MIRRPPRSTQSRSPAASDVYKRQDLLQDLGDFRGRWASIATAAPAIDIADLVVCGPASSVEAQQSFIAAALGSLFARRHRLPDSLRTVAALATEDVALGWDWTVERRAT